MKLVINILKNIDILQYHYQTFWNKIYYNKTYELYKIAILYYKNIKNEKYHLFFSGLINERLHMGRCTVATKNMRETFTNLNLNTPSSDQLCNFILQLINIFDNLFTIVPKLPIQVVAYRSMGVGNSSPLLYLKKGDYYRSLGLTSCTLNPYYAVERDYKINNTQILFTIILPKNSVCYYMNIPFIRNKEIFHEYIFDEHEFVLPRDTIFLVQSVKKRKNVCFITIQLIKNLDPTIRVIKGVYEILPSIKPSKKDIKEWKIKNIKYIKINNILPNIYKQKNIYDNKLNVKEINSNKVISISPKKIWYIISPTNKDKSYKLLKELMMGKNTVTIDKGDYIIDNKDNFLLNEILLDGVSLGIYKTDNKSNKGNKLYKRDNDLPILYLLELKVNKKILVNKYYDKYKLKDKLKCKINEWRDIKVVNSYYYKVGNGNTI